MSAAPQINYERTRPPGGNTLIDIDGAAVHVRIFPDRRAMRTVSWIAVVIGSLALIAALLNVERWSTLGLLRSIPHLSGALLVFVLAAIFRYVPNGRPASITATRDGLEYASEGLDPRLIDRARIETVFTRPAAMPTRAELGLRLVDGALLVLGAGSASEIEMAAQSVLNALNGQLRATEPGND